MNCEALSKGTFSVLTHARHVLTFSTSSLRISAAGLSPSFSRTKSRSVTLSRPHSDSASSTLGWNTKPLFSRVASEAVTLTLTHAPGKFVSKKRKSVFLRQSDTIQTGYLSALVCFRAARQK